MNKQPESTGDKGVQLICQFEGLKLERYRDAVGLWTIGYGHLILKEEMEKLIKITTGEAKNILRKDLKRTETGVKKLLTLSVTQNQFDALVSFAFNLGLGNLKKSTLLKKVNAGDKEAAALQFKCWNKAGGRVLAGLTRRRDAEMRLFLS
ncbi:lysozyme [Enterobacter cloacae complex sp. 2024EL-00215]|jgi:GH24 family phage-related lysozyme (muramidase)|uniref:Lysozyme n=1 Tax=Enterobacter mori TaxID=539813 RepID=A0A7T0DWQ1_9ENTR|nr:MULTISPECIES: lysozyme [Enterobacter]MBA7856312.1 lysozyme [Enterobacter sp. RHBSTW-00901]QPK00827.1 lysozyme [Enterobacter mori]BBS35408.1 lysozyme [Enterobacter cloacae]